MTPELAGFEGAGAQVIGALHAVKLLSSLTSFCGLAAYAWCVNAQLHQSPRPAHHVGVEVSC
jgi:hypothetical protein